MFAGDYNRLRAEEGSDHGGEKEIRALGGQSDGSRGRGHHGAPLEIHKATPGKSLRITWDGAKCVSVYFYPKPTGKTLVQVQHGKLPSARAEGAWRVSEGWGEEPDNPMSISRLPEAAVCAGFSHLPMGTWPERHEGLYPVHGK